MTNKIMELAYHYAAACERKLLSGRSLARLHLATEVQAQQDYTRAVIAERDALRKAAQMALECLDSLSNGDYLDMASEVTEVGWVDIDASAKSLRKELGHV